MVGLDGLDVRGTVDNAYERIIQTMFDSLQQMAKTETPEPQAVEDKGMLNYHVILIGASLSQAQLFQCSHFLYRKHASLCGRDFSDGDWFCG